MVVLLDDRTHARAGQELLPLEHAAEQQSDDDQHDRNFDQREPEL